MLLLMDVHVAHLTIDELYRIVAHMVMTRNLVAHVVVISEAAPLLG